MYSLLEAHTRDVVSVAVGVAAVGIAAVWSYHWNLSHQRSGEAPVKWSWLPIIGDAIELGTRPLEYLRGCAEGKEDVFGIVVAGKRMFILLDVHSSDVVFKTPKTLSYYGMVNMILTDFFGANFQEAHLNGLQDLDMNMMRKWMSNYILSDGALGILTTRMQAQLALDLAACPTGCPIPLYDTMSNVLFKASIATLLSPAAAADPDLYAAFRAFDNHLPLALGGVKVSYLSKPRNGRALLLAAMAKYRSDENCEFMKLRYNYFDEFHSDVTSAAFQLTILWASVGNTLPIAFWLLYFLLTDAAARKAVMAELQAVCPTALQGDVHFTQDQLNRLLCLDACLTEALRLCTGNLIMREVVENCELTVGSGKTYRFRKGDRVGLCPPLWHYDPELYPDPQAFRPARWLPAGYMDRAGNPPAEALTDEVMLAAQGRVKLTKRGQEIPSGAVFLPFGGGATYCPGRRFARNEVKTLAVCLLATFNVELPAGLKAPEFDGARAGLGMFPPKNDVMVTLTRR